MKSCFKAIAGSALLAVSVSSAYATDRDFNGSVCILTATALCNSMEIYKNDCFPGRFSPPNYGGNTNNTSITAFGEHQTMNFRYPAGSIVGTVLRNMTQTVIGGNIATAPVRGRIVTQAPANPNASPVTNVVGVINGIGGVACNVQFRFVGQSSPIGAGSVAGKPASSDAGDEITAGLKNGTSGY